MRALLFGLGLLLALALPAAAEERIADFLSDVTVNTDASLTVRETITVSITPELRAFIKGRLTSGRYGNASEVVRAALRLLGEHEPDLRKAHVTAERHPQPDDR